MSGKFNFTILVAPLDWGLGHATRAVPLIAHLVNSGCKVIIAAEGAQEKLLKTEFPQLQFVPLHGYRIRYSTGKRFFAIKIIAQLPKIILAIRQEKKWLKRFAAKTAVDAIISDNRYGLFHPAVPSVFITHQLLIKGPLRLIERCMQFINYQLINQFDQCWVPDFEGPENIAGMLSHPVTRPQIPIKYLGGLSRLANHERMRQEFDFILLISGPEPQRSGLEQKLLKEMNGFQGRLMLVRGLPGAAQDLPSTTNRVVKNHLPAAELTLAIAKSKYVISRSGYTTIMDIFKMGKKAVLIPTPGQTEQEYLADHLEQQGWCIKICQQDFTLQKLLERLQQFEYKLPQLNMEHYPNLLDEFLKNLPARNT